MTGDRTSARIAGICFLAAMVASLAGASILEPLLAGPDAIRALGQARPLAVAGIALEFVNAIAVILIAATLFPILKRRNEGAAMAYVGIRIAESLACVLAAFVPVLLLALGRNGQPGGPGEGLSLASSAALLLALRAGSSGLLVPLFFCLDALILYSLLYRSRILPRFIAVWGLAAVAAVAAANVAPAGLGLFPAFALPIIANEVFLGIWLIAKGFRAGSELAT
ncbi:MAG: DUF4386 domain-containing protein [Spirochaetaceae bacterium]|nr:DUF4386 domain-containing protein [Spirochaetaceae bacterium]